MAPGPAHDPVSRFVTGLRSLLQEREASGQNPPIVRRKLRTVTSDCRRRGSKAFLDTLEQQLNAGGVYSDPPLGDPSLRLDDSVLFSTGPIPPDSAFFPREKDLQLFIESCLGSGDFRNLEGFRGPGRVSGREFRLPDGRRIDLLCQERAKRGAGALVAIELKRKHEHGTVEQMVGYLDELKRLHPGREVRGIIISGREDRVSAEMLKRVTGHTIDWLCYHVTFESVARAT